MRRLCWEFLLNGFLANFSHQRQGKNINVRVHWWKIHFHLLFIRKYLNSSWACASDSSSCLAGQPGVGSRFGVRGSFDKHQWQSQTEPKDTVQARCDANCVRPRFALVIIVLKVNSPPSLSPSPSPTRTRPSLDPTSRGRMFVLRLVELISLAQPSAEANTTNISPSRRKLYSTIYTRTYIYSCVNNASGISMQISRPTSLIVRNKQKKIFTEFPAGK